MTMNRIGFNHKAANECNHREMWNAQSNHTNVCIVQLVCVKKYFKTVGKHFHDLKWMFLIFVRQKVEKFSLYKTSKLIWTSQMCNVLCDIHCCISSTRICFCAPPTERGRKMILWASEQIKKKLNVYVMSQSNIYLLRSHWITTERRRSFNVIDFIFYSV